MIYQIQPFNILGSYVNRVENITGYFLFDAMHSIIKFSQTFQHFSNTKIALVEVIKAYAGHSKMTRTSSSTKFF
jgi:hypothetical protein